MRVAVLILIVSIATPLAAHPFDEVVPSVYIRVDPEKKHIEVEYDFEYRTITASLAEQQNGNLGLDANRDGRITMEEQRARVAQYVDEVRKNAVLTVNGEPITLIGNLEKSEVVNRNMPGVPIEIVGDWQVQYFLFLRADNVAAFRAGKNEIAFHNAETRIKRSTSMADRMRALVKVRSKRDGTPGFETPLDVRHTTVDGRYDRIVFWAEIAPDVVPAPNPPDGQGAVPEPPRMEREQTGNEQTEGKLRELLNEIEQGGTTMLVALLLLFLYGMWHAIQPGHGKTLVASYLISTRGRPRDALTLGITVTLAHTSGVFLMLGIWYALEKLHPELGAQRNQMTQDILLVSLGGVILLMGAGILLRRGAGSAHRHDVFGRHVDGEHAHSHEHSHDHHAHDHSHDHAGSHDHTHDHHDHHHAHAHSHHDPGAMSTWQVIRLGIIGGMLPCPSAFALALLTIIEGKVLLGIGLVLVFSLGLALVLSLIGFAMIATRGYLQRTNKGRGRLYRFAESYLPTLGALAITLLGFLLVIAALERMGVVSLTSIMA